MIDENSSEAPPSNYSDAPVSKKLRLMPHDGDQNIGNSWGARSKKELEGNGKKWVEFLKKPPPNAGENPNEVIHNQFGSLETQFVTIISDR